MFKRRLLLLLAFAACSTTLVPVHAAAATSQAWARPGTDNVAVYFTLKNDRKKPLTLVGARSPVAASVAVHKSAAMNMGAGENTMGGMTMETVGSITVEPHQQIEFAPGGYHLMLMHMRRSLKLGQHFPVVLLFRDKSRELVVVTVDNR